MQVSVHLLPQIATPSELYGATVVVIDVLRATTTILAALEAGARSVIPVQDVEEAKKIADSFSPRPLLGGERDGMRIPGFDLGNSPEEYTPHVVAGRDIIFSTTNGTRALQACRDADQVLLASFTNRSAVANRIRTYDNVQILCAGTDGHVTCEDAWLAGALIDHRCASGPQMILNDSARLCWHSWLSECGSRPSPDRLYELLLTAGGSHRLCQLGNHADIRFASRLDGSTAVAAMNLATWQVKLAEVER